MKQTIAWRVPMRDGDRLRLTVVGCAAAWSRVPGRASSSYLVEMGAPGDPAAPSLLLDLGQGSFAALSGFRDPATLGAVLISHSHPDHCIDLVPLRLYLRYGCEPSRSVPLHGPAELRRRFDGLTNEHDFLCDLPGAALTPGETEVAGFTVSVAPVLHVGTSFAFRVANPADPSAAGLVYSGDCGRAADLLPLVRPGDTLLVEASHGAGPVIEGPNHLNAADAAWVGTTANAGRLVITHILDDVDPVAAFELARGQFAGETLLAEPGLRVEI
jgi:ribonuclease BN (tRNA processing enzyme)